MFWEIAGEMARQAVSRHALAEVPMWLAEVEAKYKYLIDWTRPLPRTTRSTIYSQAKRTYIITDCPHSASAQGPKFNLVSCLDIKTLLQHLFEVSARFRFSKWVRSFLHLGYPSRKPTEVPKKRQSRILTFFKRL